MKKKRIIQQGRLKLLAVFVCLFCFKSFAKLDLEAEAGRKLFEGSMPLQNGGPACISCHNVQHPKLVQGGLLAKDLSKVYDRLGEGISGWLSAPPPPAMIVAYKDNVLTENERGKLMSFFKEANEINKNEPTDKQILPMVLAGIGGLVLILISISILWAKRKKGTVKASIFARQSSARDAKF